MKADPIRLRTYCMEIRKNSEELNLLIDQNDLTSNSLPLKAAKYILIELAEAMSNTIQHLLAKEKGVAVSGYIDAVAKANEYGIISDDLFQKLKPFFDFRNSLVHRYWKVDDNRLIENIKAGRNDFDSFVIETESFIEKCMAS